ncbi:restriction endonuclease subunit S [Paracoccus sediminis]|uniref:Restriction endonuclease subunit S n=1 Tax=Paracoccus sediminis TaxID=1214787 RepID=A0A238UKU6_9RHOB|nr:restriction endonuclease subunit S [Paracoccus sediminis]TBN53168.1 restriction endonuclease subunit S [Paracoccus sediminis]SNR22712.1 type I restriction enzyme, S subunit [Paracoccus sediminis]
MTLAAWPTYDNYKESGVEWIGEVPADWRVEPGRQCLYENKDKNTGMKESTVLSLSYGRVIVKDEDKLTGLVPESFETYQIVQPGDIIIRGTDLQNDMTSLRTGLARDTGIITSAYINLRPKAEIDPAFLHYLLHSYDVKKVFYALGSGLRQNLSYDDFKYLRLPIPSPEEQRAIAAFLDEKCAKVDEAVRIKEEQIALLRERRQILIQQAVTRGLNPSAPMKDSRIDWIGQIPAHWEVKRLKHLGNAVIGLTYDPKDLCDEDEGTLVLRSSNLKSGKFVYGDGLNAYVRMRIPEKLRIRANDILICSRNGSRDLIGKCALATHDDTGASFGAFTTVFRSEMNRYIFQILNSEIFRMLAGSFLTATINQLTTSNLNSISVPIPPPEERQALTEHLEGLNGEYDRAISFKEDQIAALKEYKTSLINAAVTGKIKVA